MADVGTDLRREALLSDAVLLLNLRAMEDNLETNFAEEDAIGAKVEESLLQPRRNGRGFYFICEAAGSPFVDTTRQQRRSDPPTTQPNSLSGKIAAVGRGKFTLGFLFLFFFFNNKEKYSFK